MCNEARRRIALGQLREDWGETRIPLRFPEGAPNMAPLASVRITDSTVIIRASAEQRGEAELVTRRWSWPGQGGRPVYNFRSEGRKFRNGPDGGRCLIPVDGFYEFTDSADATKRRKDKWLFTWPSATPGGWFCIAGLWRQVIGTDEAFTMLTTQPGPDMAPYHARQVVLLQRADWAAWISGEAAGAELIKPLAAGTLHVEQVG